MCVCVHLWYMVRYDYSIEGKCPMHSEGVTKGLRVTSCWSTFISYLDYGNGNYRYSLSLRITQSLVVAMSSGAS